MAWMTPDNIIGGGALDRVWRRGSKDPDIPVAV
jgi:hypothetical protein